VRTIVTGSAFDAALAAGLAARAHAGLLRDDALPWQPAGVDFGTNDYLGLARDPAIAEAMAAAVHECGSGARSARLLAGGSPWHERAEAAVAAWLAAESALLFPSGYQANIGLLAAIAGHGDVVLSDRDNHASWIDGARLSRARVLVHDHLDLAAIERELRATAGARRRLVVTEGVFSMRGDLAPLAAIAELCCRHDAGLVVDEAHAIGLLGVEGAGAWAAAAVPVAHRHCLVARIVTGGKALGVGGAFVVGSRVLRAHLVNHARSFLFTTAPPPAVAAGLWRAVGVCRAADSLRAQLRGNVARLAAGLGVAEPPAAILPFTVGDAVRATALAAELRANGYYVPAVRPPTVPRHAAGLRVVVHARHQATEIDGLARWLRDGSPAPVRTVPESVGRSRRPLVVVGTDTGIGKTVVSALLLRAAATHGPARYWKPIQTGSDDDTATVQRLANAPPEAMLPPFATFPLPASPHTAAAAAGARLDLAAIEAALRDARNDGRRLLVELAGGLLVPYSIDTGLVTQADLLARNDVDCVVVARAGLGTLNHTLLTLEALRSRRLEPRALFLVGEPHPANVATLRSVADVEVFEVPWFTPPCASSFDNWLAANDVATVFA
jgi:8-amino-7-oxononanoate synthase